MLKLIKRYMPPITEYRVDLYEHEGPLLRLKLQVNIPHQRWGIFENHGPLKDAEVQDYLTTISGGHPSISSVQLYCLMSTSLWVYANISNCWVKAAKWCAEPSARFE